MTITKPVCPDQDCQVPVGTVHLPDCTVAVCLDTGRQRLQHLLNIPDEGQVQQVVDRARHDCGQDVWSGQEHGVAECIEFGWFVRRALNEEELFGDSWIPCDAATPGARPDRQRLTSHAVWNAELVRWVARTAVAGRG